MTIIRGVRRGRGRGERSRIVLVCGLAILVAASCRKAPAPIEQKDVAPPADAAAAPSQPGAEALPPPAAPTPNVTARAENALRGNVSGEVNEFLTKQLRTFIQRKGRLPQNFAEFAQTSLDGVPGAPNGMKWVIDSATQQVKAAAK